MSEEQTAPDGPEWPEHLPDGCPPTDAHPLAPTLYRTVKNNPPSRRDFKSHHEIGRKLKPGACPCRFGGLSASPDLADIHKAREAIPLLRAKHIAVGTVEPSEGVMLRKRGDHGSTVWFRAASIDSMHERFVVVPGE